MHTCKVLCFCKRKDKMKMAVTLPLCRVQGMLVEKHFYIGTLGKGLQIKV